MLDVQYLIAKHKGCLELTDMLGMIPKVRVDEACFHEILNIHKSLKDKYGDEFLDKRLVRIEKIIKKIRTYQKNYGDSFLQSKRPPVPYKEFVEDSLELSALCIDLFCAYAWVCQACGEIGSKDFFENEDD